MRKTKQGVSLIVLVITILVMIILASAVILSLDQGDIREKAKKAVEKTNLQEVQNIATLAWAEAYVDKLEDKTVDIKARVLAALAKNKVDITEYFIDFSSTGVSVKEKTTIRLSSVSKTETILKGTTKDIGLTAITEDDVKLTWSSNNESVAAVVESGSAATITLKAAGTAVITVTGGGDIQTCTITVVEKDPKLTLDKTTITESLITGNTKTVQITATAVDIDETLTWSSNNESVATVVGSGTTARVTLKAGGTAIITATAEGIAQSCEVTVTELVPKITLNKTTHTKTVYENGYYTFTLTATTENITEQLEWNNPKPDYITITPNGNSAEIKVVFKPTGLTKIYRFQEEITVSANGVSATCFIDISWTVAGTGTI